MPDNTIELSVILPAYNEGAWITRCIQQVKNYLDNHGVLYEIIVVNDGSKDDTLLKARALAAGNIKIISYADNRGKGYAVNQGMKAAAGKNKLFMDVDLSTALDMIEQFLRIGREGQYDVVIGNRKSHPHLQKVKQPFYRQFFGAGFTKISSLFIGHACTDFTCGFKMFTARGAEVIFSRQRIWGWSFDTELIYIALVQGLRIKEVPVVWSYEGDSKVRVMREIFTSFQGLLAIRFNALRGLYR